MYDDDTKLTFIRSKWLDGSGKIIVRSPLGCKREYYLFQIPKKYQRAIMKMKEEFGYRDNCPHDKNWL
jgi:S-ribosylhomocysteine lyase LuxS involved in autoinducer biosynthesis